MKLKRGINFGGWLSQCDHTQERYGAFIGKVDVERVALWGFDHIRLPFDYNVIEDEEGNDKPEGYAYLEKMADWCKTFKLNLIIDLHKAAGYDFSKAGSDLQNALFNSESLKKRFIALWEKVASRYGDNSHVAFELLNEVVEQNLASSWNSLIADAVRAIRKHAPKSIIIYGGIRWNSARTLKLLEKPADENIIFTFHFYEPFVFTHQKARWEKRMNMDMDVRYPETMDYYNGIAKSLGYSEKNVAVTEGAATGKTLIAEMVREAKDAADKAGVALYCGEFGVIDQARAPDTLAWFRDVLSIFASHDIGCSVWSYKQMSFGLVDAHYDSIRDDLIGLYVKRDE